VRAPFLLLLGLAACSTEHLGRSSQAGTVCADGPVVRGIDVSSWQGDIDWDAVAASGVKLAFVRVNHGLAQIDAKFAFNWSEARRVGLVRGAYQYYEPGESTSAQAQLLLDKLGPLEPDDLPPVLDVEEAGSRTPTQLTAAIAAWLDQVTAATGRRPIVYTSPSFWKDKVGAPSDFVDHPLWIANYNVTCPLIAEPWTRWDFWQKSSTGTVAGISGPVDLDEFNGDDAALAGFVAGTSVCGDGRCLPGETAGACPADCAACVLGADGGEIDDAAGCFTVLGRPASWRTEAAGVGASLRWTYAWDEPDENVGTWTFEPAQAGRYRVEVHTPAPWAGSQGARYRVRHAGVEEVVTLDQAASDGWRTLGEWDFAAGGDQRVRLGDSTGEPFAERRKIVFDAIRLSRLAEPEPPDAAEPASDLGQPANADGGVEHRGDDGGGCALAATSTVSDLPSWLLLSLGLPWARRAARARRAPRPARASR
jgi:lysozyme